MRNKYFWSLVVVVFFGVLAGRSLIFEPGYFNMHDDLQMMRQLVMEECILAGQIPCRWTPHMGYGFGFPLFNYYPPLPYLIGELFRVFGFSFVNTVKFTFALSFIVSGVTMYLLAKEFFPTEVKLRGVKYNLGALVSSVFYIWAPYHAVDVYVRGAMNEAWALAWFPLILWTAYRLIKEKKNLTKWTITLALAYFALFTSHNLMILIFTPVVAGWILIFLWKEKKWSRLVNLAKSGFLAFGLSAFFTLPVLLEKGLVQVETLVVGYYEYIAHFASIGQLLFTRFWGYGPSVWQVKDDGMPFQIGHIHWILSLVLGVWLMSQFWTKKAKLITFLRKNAMILATSYMFLVGWFSIFLAHNKSTFIWEAIKPLEFVQFPWRFLAIGTFAFSFLAGLVVMLFKDKKLLILVSGIFMVGVVVFNWNYFKPEREHMGSLTDEEKFSGVAWEMQQTAGIYDYLPKAAKQAPQSPMENLAEIIEGEGVVTNPTQGTNWSRFDINVESDEAVLRLGIFDFPNWKLFVDGEEVETFITEEEMWGRMHMKVSKGEHQIYAKLYSTFPRIAGNIISLGTWIGLLSYPKWRKKT